MEHLQATAIRLLLQAASLGAEAVDWYGRCSEAWQHDLTTLGCLKSSQHPWRRLTLLPCAKPPR